MVKSGTVTVKLAADRLAPVGVVTLIGPLVAPDGTVRVIWVSELTVNDAEVPFTAAAVAPVKLAPVTVTVVPTGPLVGENPLIVGAGADPEARMW